MKYLSEDEQSLAEKQEQVSKLCWASLFETSEELSTGPVFLVTDGTPSRKEYARTLADRQAISVPNATRLSKTQLSVGYKLSAVNVCNFCDNWSLPISVQRIGFDQTETSCGQEQLAGLLKLLGPDLRGRLVINLGDSGYGNGKFLAPLYEHAELVNIVRLQTGSKVFECHDRSQGQPNKYYGAGYYLRAFSAMKAYKKKNEQGTYEVWQPSLHDRPADEEHHWQEQFSKSGRVIEVTIKRWNTMLLRTKGGLSMKDKPVDIACIMLRDAKSKESIFKNDLYLCISGQKRTAIETPQLRAYYKRRNDIEAFFRLAKKRLLLEKFQSSRLQHLDNWLLVVQLAAHLWWQAGDEIQAAPYPWERYNPKYKQAAEQASAHKRAPNTKRLSMAMTCRAMQGLLSTLDLKPFLPPESKGGIGRAKGTRLKPKKRYSMRRKTKKRKAS